MNTNLFFLLCVCVVPQVLGQQPEPCEPPPQISFRVSQYEPPFSLIAKYTGMYDVDQQRVMFLEERLMGVPVTQYVQFIFLYKEGVVYEFNLSSLNCSKSPSGPFHSWGVPQNATLRDTYTLGGPRDGFEAVEWSNVLYTKGETWIGVYTRLDCFPVLTTVFDTYWRNSSVTTYAYDMTEGLTDPDKFVPPYPCQIGRVTEASLSEKGQRLLNLFKDKTQGK
ncbi:mammalian ependymin-related protein 1-like [Aplysia californica]|uniref:Mammalian ependymin-related protein 1-like n=1 Tax=Aplysia californica TaxID=6500 RepID=A0ABM0ZUI7_APLCA|nr:mammalian ependymin-related protein 1-like [Aplysia californica]